MMSFIIGQLIGILSFFMLNFSIFCYIRHQKNKVKEKTSQNFLLRFGYQLLIVFLCTGLSYRIYVLQQNDQYKYNIWRMEYQLILKNFPNHHTYT